MIPSKMQTPFPYSNRDSRHSSLVHPIVMNNASKTCHLSQHSSYFLSAMLLYRSGIQTVHAVLCRRAFTIPGYSMGLSPASCTLLYPATLAIAVELKL